MLSTPVKISIGVAVISFSAAVIRSRFLKSTHHIAEDAGTGGTHETRGTRRIPAEITKADITAQSADVEYLEEAVGLPLEFLRS
jgi:hypothetical protein